MAKISFHKVLAMPESTEPNSLYLVENGSYAEAYVTDSTGTPKSIGNSEMINALISQALANWEGPEANPEQGQ